MVSAMTSPRVSSTKKAAAKKAAVKKAAVTKSEEEVVVPKAESEPDPPTPDPDPPTVEPVPEPTKPADSDLVSISLSDLDKLIEKRVAAAVEDASGPRRVEIVMDRIELEWNEEGRFARNDDHPQGFLGAESSMWRRYDNGDWKLGPYQDAVRRTIAQHNLAIAKVLASKD